MKNNEDLKENAVEIMKILPRMEVVYTERKEPSKDDDSYEYWLNKVCNNRTEENT